MARAVPTPVWIDFEHLSAEPWVDGFHGLPSPHPTRALVKHFFYPGFGEPTGGLLVEPDLDARRAAFVADAVAVDGWRRRIGLDADDGARRLSLFAYDDAPVGALLDALAASSAAGGPRWSVVVPDGVAVAAIDAWLAGAPRSTPPTIARIPFVDQDDYDRLLWTCDVNVVRGEDSFVRAQAAGRPFVWQAYRQPDDAQRPKIGAFLDRFDARARSRRPGGDAALLAGVERRRARRRHRPRPGGSRIVAAAGPRGGRLASPHRVGDAARRAAAAVRRRAP